MQQENLRCDFAILADSITFSAQKSISETALTNVREYKVSPSDKFN